MANINLSDDVEKRYCICRSTESKVFMIMCDNCGEWYHGNCVNITRRTSKNIDKYYCIPCKEKNPFLITTYCQKNKYDKLKRSNSSKLLNAQISTDSVPGDHFLGNKTGTEKTESSCTGRLGLKQCYGPSCTKAARKKSKYCSDDCGIALAKNRILEILPTRIKEWMSTPSVADENCEKKLFSLRAQLHEVQSKIEETDIKIVQLIEKINRAKRPGNFFVELKSDDASTSECSLCGVEVQTKSFAKHLEQCYRRQDKKIFITQNTVMPDDVQWNVFCNHRISKHIYCKKLRVLCPLHYKDFRKDDEVCGYELVKNGGIKMHCGNIGKTCNHVNWEEIERAELDLRKLNLLLKYNSLKKEEMRTRNEMAARGHVLGLMLHQTIVHNSEFTS